MSDETEDTAKADGAESWLRRFRPAGPRPELKDAILARCAEEEQKPGEGKRRFPWLDLGIAAFFAAALAANLAVESASRARLHVEPPATKTPEERQALDFVRSQGIGDGAREERLVAALAPRPKGRGSALWHVAIETVR